MYAYKLIRSNRRTIQIQILPDKTIEVRAPKYVSKTRIDNFVISKENWINKKIAEKKELARIPVKHFYVSGETFYFRGKQYILKTRPESAKKSAVFVSGNYLFIQTKNQNPQAFKNAFVKWQKEMALTVFNELFDECWAHFANYYPKYIKPALYIRAMKTRWGSLSQKSKKQQASMTLNTFLICADNNCIKQVIYHELCHLIYPNHGKGFYECFEFFVPDWKKLKNELEGLFIADN